MRGRLSLVLSAVALTACFAGPPPPGLCEATDDCDAGFVCIGTKCKPACTDAFGCAAGQACLEGACQRYAASCSDNDDSACAEGFFCSDSGSCERRLEQGAACAEGTDCRTGHCVEGVCCDAPCGTTCSSCLARHTSGADGQCLPARQGEDPGDRCGTIFACSGRGDCTRPNGAVCEAHEDCLLQNCTTDNVCCDTACEGPCVACVASLTAEQDGKCADVVAGKERENGCTGGAACDGEGACSATPLGASCSADWQCASGFCVDDVCCQRECDGVCEVCGTGGICQAKLSGPDRGTCDSANVVGTCTSAPCECLNGTCAPGAGTPCAAGSPCANCVDGYCCDSPCAADCMACSSAFTGVSSGTCAPIAANTDPLDDCTGATACDGAGNCHDDPPGAQCESAATCDSGFCVDGVCCGTGCSERCYACNSSLHTGVASGTCGAIDLGFDVSDECIASLSCNGAGSCVVAAEQETCSSGSQCATGICCGGKCRQGWALIGPGSPWNNARLFSVWGSSISDLYVGGDNGLLLRFDGASWTQQASGLSTEGITHIAGSQDQVVALAQGRMLRTTDRQNWSVVEGVPPGAHHLLILGPSTVRAYGSGSAAQWSSGAWAPIDTIPATNWRSLWTRAGSTMMGGYEDSTVPGLVPRMGRVARYDATSVAEDLWSGAVIGSGAALDAATDLLVVRPSTTSNEARVFTLREGSTQELPELFGSQLVGSSGAFALALGTEAAWNYAGTGWAKAPLPFPLVELWVASECEAFAVGTGGVVKF